MVFENSLSVTFHSNKCNKKKKIKSIWVPDICFKNELKKSAYIKPVGEICWKLEKKIIRLWKKKLRQLYEL